MSGGLHYLAAKEAADKSLSDVSGDPLPETSSEEASNDASLSQLEQMMKGLG